MLLNSLINTKQRDAGPVRCVIHLVAKGVRNVLVAGTNIFEDTHESCGLTTINLDEISLFEGWEWNYYFVVDEAVFVDLVTNFLWELVERRHCFDKGRRYSHARSSKP